jgi:hypothetical protein
MIRDCRECGVPAWAPCTCEQDYPDEPVEDLEEEEDR